MSGALPTQAELTSLYELLAVCSTVFEEDPFVSPNASAMSLRRIQKATLKAQAVFASAPIIGKGAGHST